MWKRRLKILWNRAAHCYVDGARWGGDGAWQGAWSMGLQTLCQGPFLQVLLSFSLSCLGYFFFNSLIVGEYVGIYQSEWLKNKNVNLWNLARAIRHNTCVSRSRWKASGHISGTFFTHVNETLTRAAHRRQTCPRTSAVPGWDHTLQERRPRRQGSMPLWFPFRAACNVAFDKH